MSHPVNVFSPANVTKKITIFMKSFKNGLPGTFTHQFLLMMDGFHIDEKRVKNIT